MSAIDPIVLGWREWLSLPELHDVPMQAKIDSGAKTSALHAQSICVSYRHDGPWVRFIAPSNGAPATRTIVTAPVIDFRSVQSSNGQSEVRPVIKTELVVGERSTMIELTLTNRDQMGFELLVGRSALGEILIDPSGSFLLGVHDDHRQPTARTESGNPVSCTGGI